MHRAHPSALEEDDGDGESGGKRGAGEVYRVVAEAAGAFQSCSEEAIDEGSEESGAGDAPVEAGEQKIGPLGTGADEEDGAEGEDGAGDGDAAILAGCDLAPGGDEPAGTAEDLAELAAHGVSGRFGESSRSCGEKNVGRMCGEDQWSGADGGDSKVGKDLQGAAPVATLVAAPCYTQALLLAAADAGGDQREQEDEDDRNERRGTGCQAEDEGKQDFR